jgi:hypothetical protein
VKVISVQVPVTRQGKLVSNEWKFNFKRPGSFLIFKSTENAEEEEEINSLRTGNKHG